MPSIEILIAFTLTAMVLNVSPGPSNLYVMARSISQGVRGGLVAAVGLATGSLFHILAAVLGLSAIFEHSPTLYVVIKLVGAAYLIYLGLSYWRTQTQNADDEPKSNDIAKTRTRAKSNWAIFRESIIVEVTNPKTALFFIALLPQFVVPESGPVAQQMLILGLIVTFSALPCDVVVAFSSSKVSNWLIKNEKAQQLQERISGSILLGLGAFIVVEEVQAANR